MTDAAVSLAGSLDGGLGRKTTGIVSNDALSGGGLVFVDFDHTLFACNSTELFIATCRPSAVAAIIEFVVRRCIPWRLTGLRGHGRLRDFICCLAIMVICPWSLPIWRRKAPELFKQYVSGEIASRLSEVGRERVVIVSFGMTAVIKPLLADSLWRNTRLMATPSIPSLQYFARGKLPLVRGSFSDTQIEESTFLTDSLDDADLLEASGRGILIEPQGDPFRAVEHLYIPLRYTARAKYTFSYVLDQVLFVECLMVVIATATTFGGFLSRAACVPLFTLSLMCIYEIGYFENDMVAAAREDAPTLTKQAMRFRNFPIQPAAWFWAIAAAAAGGGLAWFTGAMQTPFLLWAALIWLGTLILLRSLFYAYNRVRMAGRIALYPVLQVMKYLPFFFLFPSTLAGAILAFCQVTTMSLIYLVYRQTGHRRIFDKEQFRTGLFAFALCFMATASTVEGLGGRFALGLMSVWCLVRLAKAPFLDWVRGRRKRALQT